MKPTRLSLLFSLFLLLPIYAHLQLANDVSISEENVIAPYMRTDYYRMFDGFPIGATIVNQGANDQDSVYVSATVRNQQGDTLYSDMVGPIIVLSQDSLMVYENGNYSFSAYNPPVETYLAGEFTLEYAVQIPQDADSSNNSVITPFTLLPDAGDVELTTANIDQQGKPLHNSYPNPFTTENTTCIFWEEPNTFYFRSNPYAYYFTGLNFVQHVDTGDTLYGTEQFIYLIEWEDGWTNTNDSLFSTPNAAFQDLNYLTFNVHYPNSNVENDTVVYVPFDTHIYPNSQSRYLACVQSHDSHVRFGFDSTRVLNNYYDSVKQPVGATNIDGYWSLINPVGGIPSISMTFSDFHWGIEEATKEQLSLYPNPVVEILNLELNTNDKQLHAEIIDLNGRVISTHLLSPEQGKASIDTQSLMRGSYVLLIKQKGGGRYYKQFQKK